MARYKERDLGRAFDITQDRIRGKFDASLSDLNRQADQVALTPPKNILSRFFEGRRIRRAARKFEDSAQRKKAMNDMFGVQMQQGEPIFLTEEGYIYRWVFGTLQIDGTDVDKETKSMIKGKYYKIMDEIEATTNLAQTRIRENVISHSK